MKPMRTAGGPVIAAEAVPDLTSPSRNASPDQHADGLLLKANPFRNDPLRYDYHSTDPYEVAGMIAALVPQGARVLDVGCGTGGMSRILMDTRGVTLVGIEPDPERVALAQSRGVDARHGLFDERSAPSLGTFDAVVFADVLEHLPEPAAPLRLAHSVLSPAGMVIASVPNIAHWSVRLDLFFGRFDYEPYGIMDATHLRWFTETTLRGLFDAAGYSAESVLHTAGTGLEVYRRRLPWRIMSPGRVRTPLVRRLSRAMPRLFGCQHVICARRVRKES